MTDLSAILMEPIKINDSDIKKAIQLGNPYIQVGKKKFLLIEVEEANNEDCYEITDPDEEKQLLEALNGNNPILSEEQINKLLGN